MCEEGGKKAIAGLNGYHSHQITKPLLVELSHEVWRERGREGGREGGRETNVCAWERVRVQNERENERERVCVCE